MTHSPNEAIYPWLARLGALTALAVIVRLLYTDDTGFSAILLLPGILFFINLLALPGKKALAWSVVLGAITFLFSLLMLILTATGFFSKRSAAIFVFKYIGLLALAQVALAWGAIRTYYARERVDPERDNPEHKRKDLRILTGAIIGGAIFAFVFLLTLAAIPNLIRSKVRRNDARAVYSLQVLNEALAAYRKDHPASGFPASLTALQPYSSYNGHRIDPLILCNGSSCVKDGYVFSYKLKDSKPPAPGYSLTARPVHFDWTGLKNLYTDESGSIHLISEDRAPLASDTPLDYEPLKPGQQEPQVEDVD
ncbi:MAG TPA: hypothetical protein VK699_14600 [Terriglobales bacterium]|jgi:hypothetical protein|nr:hypothetical protein [Terriglobales bacterium]